MDNNERDDSYQSDIQDNFNNAYSHSRKNSLKLLKLFLEKFGNLSPHNDIAEQSQDQDSIQNKTPY